jgi:hypothetical protein
MTNWISSSPEQGEMMAAVRNSAHRQLRATGCFPLRVFLSREALMPFYSETLIVDADGETDVSINGIDVYYDPCLRGKSCYCRLE